MEWKTVISRSSKTQIFISKKTLKFYLTKIPHGHILTQVWVKLVGAFNCKNEAAGSDVVIALQTTLVAIDQLPATPMGCDCPSCGSVYTIQSESNPGGWSGYNYETSNVLSIVPTDTTNSMCVSFVNLTLIYTLSVPTIYFISPETGPVFSENTTVFVWGSGFNDDLVYYCLFGNLEKTKATYVDKQYISCSAPAFDSVTTLNFQLEVAINAYVISTPLSFSYYGEFFS